jgi:hypothetical protein
MQIEQEKKTTTFKTIEENPHLLAKIHHYELAFKPKCPKLMPS